MIEIMPDMTEDIEEFFQGVRTGRRQQSLALPFDLQDRTKTDCCTDIQTAYVQTGENTGYVVGSVHVNREGHFEGYRKVEVDDLTGVLAKGEVTRQIMTAIDVRKTKNVSIAIIDVDYFKNVNDTYGHMMGDEVLRDVAQIIEKQVGRDGMVGRIGGDEFMVLFFDTPNLEETRGKVKSIKNAVKVAFPDGIEDRPKVTLSMGCSAYPKDADNYEDLFALADYSLYLAKNKGRDRYIIYSKDKHGSLADIKQMHKEARLDGRGSQAKGDILCSLMDMCLEGVRKGEKPELQNLLDEFVVSFGIQRLMIFAGDDMHVKYSAGEGRPDDKTLSIYGEYIKFENYKKRFGKYGELLCNDVNCFKNTEPEIYECLRKLKVDSMVQFKERDAAGQEFILSIEQIDHKGPWNSEYMKYYRLFGLMLTKYTI